MRLRAQLALAAAFTLAACASNPAPGRPVRPPQVAAAPGSVIPIPPQLTPPEPAAPQEFNLAYVTYGDIPGWVAADLAPALSAIRRQCESWRQRSPDAALTGGRYGGSVSAWLPACGVADTVLPGQERWFFETHFDPAHVTGTGEARLTAYFEPVIEARRASEPGFTEPLLRRPGDMLTVDLGAFAEAYDSAALRGAPRTLTGRQNGTRIEPYPKREAILPQPGQIIAWAHPADVYNLQVQGSGRFRFPDGQEARAQFAAQNGYKWNSALGALRNTGRLAAASWANFRAWLNSNPGEAKSALDADPSYVFFQDETISDPTGGPRGAANLPLTALGSMAVDPAYHPYGALIFVDGVHDGYAFQRLMVAQDTGGAIKRGPLRGDVFFGSGPEAGLQAEKMNAPARWWTLVPRPQDQRVARLH
ncbi:MAG: MltA domain-containing protein [Alphaproteobacteria bacterium]|nr:MltA domain-containing protein [Alphaproteobacteria bacterium]